MLIEFKPWHLDMMRLSNNVRDLLGKYPAPSILTALAGAGLAYTLVADEGEEVRILGVVGASPIREGVAEVFVVAAEDRQVHRMAFVKGVRRILDRAQARFAMIEAIGAEGVPGRWFEWLGFTDAGDGRWRLAGGKT